MRRWNALGIACLLVIASVSGVSGQDTDAGRSLSMRQKWARFAVVHGRVTVFVTRGQGGAAWTEEKAETFQSFGICCESGGAKIRFERRTANETVLIQFLGTRELVISRLPNADGVMPLHFVQPPTGDLRLTIGAGDSAKTVTAPTLWHLAMVERELCCRELVPLLAHLRCDWRLEQQVAALEQQIFTAAYVTPPADWQQLVTQLGDPQFQKRQSADRQLRSYGQSILPMLETIDASRLDREQRKRLQSIRDALAEKAEDVPQRLVAWLGNDRRFWEALRENANAQWRSAAEQNLARLDMPASATTTEQNTLATTDGESP